MLLLGPSFRGVSDANGAAGSLVGSLDGFPWQAGTAHIHCPGRGMYSDTMTRLDCMQAAPVPARFDKDT